MLSYQFPRWSRLPRLCIASALVSGLIGCAATQNAPVAEGGHPIASNAGVSKALPAREQPLLPPAGSGRGGYYQDDGPGDKVPEGLQSIPDAEPKIEPYASRGNSPYVVFGKTYTPMLDNRPFKQRGIGSWYGKKFHGQKTSSGELYDMYKMTAAHPTLPIPSYARITNLANGKQVIVRVNDRGPFHSARIVDLSYTAALKLGYVSQGSSELEVERLLPEDIARMANGKQQQAMLPAPPAMAADVSAAPMVAVSSHPVESVSAQAVSMEGNRAYQVKDPPQNPVQSGASEATPFAVPVATIAGAAAIEPIASVAAVASAPMPATPASGVYIQLGAFSQAGNAETVRSQLRQNWPAALPPIEVVPNAALYKLYSGPFATRADALAAVQQIHQLGVAKPLVVQR